MTNVLALPTGTELVGDFRIERTLGAGGFGITYLARETALDRLVTLKEYFPTELAVRSEANAPLPRDPEAKADFEWGLTRFIDEAQALARFDHHNIVKVYRYFRANDTAYMVLHFEEGQSLKGWLRGLGRHPRQKELDAIVAPLLDALEVVHAADFLHRDIAPDNVIIRTDGSPVLIDFGSARGDIATRSRTVSALVKPGYSPYEQYAENGVRQGPWTDIYALGATLYHAISGKRPPDAPSRVVKDELVPAREAALASYRQGFLAAIDRALALEPERRPQSVAAWRGDLLAPDATKSFHFKRQAKRTADGELPAGKTRALSDQPGVAPLPPDVPAAKGALLDFVDGLKQQANQGKPAAPSATTQPHDPADQTPPPTPKPTTRPKRALVAMREKPVAAAKARSPRPPKPRPAAWAKAPSWRSFAFKLLIGAGIAGTAVAMQDKIPGADAGATSRIVTSAFRPAPPRLPTIAGHRGGTTAMTFTDDGQSIVTTGADATLRMWSASSGSLARTLDLAAGPATSLAVLGRRALTGHADGSIELWDLTAGTRIGLYKSGDAGIASLAFAGDGTHFVASSDDATAAVWDAGAAAAPVAVLAGHADAVQAVAYSGHGPYIATGSADRTVKLWRAGSNTLVRTYRGNRELVTALAFSPDGRYLASGAADGSVRVWHTSSSTLSRINTGQQSRIVGLAFAPSGDVIASAGEDGTVRLWQIRQGRASRLIAEQGSPLKALAFAPDGRRVAVASAEGTVHLWDATPPVKTK